MTINSYSEVPRQFTLCANDNCPWRDTCLRQIAMQLLPDSEERIRVINPRLTAQPQAAENGDCNCAYYRENRPVLYARGFTKMEDLMTVPQFRSYRSRFLYTFGRNPFYERRSGKIALSPKEQALIRHMLDDLGITIDNPFDTLEERIDWSD